MQKLENEVQFIKGVGPTRAQLLQKLGIYTLEDLITYYPRDYKDRSKPKMIASLQDGEETLIEAMVVSKMNEQRIRKNMTIYKLIVRDETGTCILTWFNQKYLKNKFVLGQKYKFYGKVSIKYGRIEMNSPVYDADNTNKNTGKIIPLYPLTFGLYQNTIRQVMENAIEIVEKEDILKETLPQYILEQYHLEDIKKATKQIHFPDNFKEFEEARKRLVFEELLTMQLALMSLKNKYTKEEKGITFDKNVKMSDVINELPFRLTKAQLRVLEEIDNDMENSKPMNRLLQGDVGSGKTVVAMIASYKTVKCGYQVAIMAPTAILASQHLESFNKILEKFGIKSELLIGSVTKKKKEEILQKLENGEIDILIGTHALLEENVVFKNLGLVVTDEQHRFGVRQRGIIVNKGKNPDVLVMTATPIPRTLALILYGDLDISIIDELPPNRKKIDTFAVTKSMEQRVNNFIKKQVDEGRQAYIVCPLVEENEEINAKAVLELFENYKQDVFPKYRVEYLHGKMRPKEKDAIMQEFKEGKINILISTTVIEVGVDVPNASIMVIENAERFGLAQLHQLRGRVGRGEYKSYCILKYQGKSEIIKKRMKTMQDTNDGFKIANLFEDMQTLKLVQSLSIKIEQEDPKLELEKNRLLKELINKKIKNRIEI